MRFSSVIARSESDDCRMSDAAIWDASKMMRLLRLVGTRNDTKNCILQGTVR